VVRGVLRRAAFAKSAWPIDASTKKISVLPDSTFNNSSTFLQAPRQRERVRSNHRKDWTIRPENVQRQNSGLVARARIYPVDINSAIDQFLLLCEMKMLATRVFLCQHGW
jgi:hypothetical protein